MKYIVLFVLFSFLILSCQNSQKKTEQKVEPKAEITAENLQKVKIEVEGMTCGGCEKSVVTGLESLEGVQRVKASHEEKYAIVHFDKTKLKPEDLKSKITDIGYQVGNHEEVK